MKQEYNCSLPKLGLTTVYGIHDYKCNLIRNSNCKECMIKSMNLQSEYFKQLKENLPK